MTGLRIERDDAVEDLWNRVRRVRTGVKSVFGDDSSDYEVVGGSGGPIRIEAVGGGMVGRVMGERHRRDGRRDRGRACFDCVCIKQVNKSQ